MTLFAGDSSTAARLVRCSPMALRLDEAVADALPHHMLMLDQLRQRHRQFDVLHFHRDQLVPTAAPAEHTSGAYPPRSSRPARPAAVLSKVPRPRPGVDLQVEREHLPSRQVDADDPSWAAAVLLSFNPRPARLPCLFGPVFRPRNAPTAPIEIASRVGLPLKIAAKVHKADSEHWREVISRWSADAGRVHRRDQRGREGRSFLGNASALVFPIDWFEPFGLAMIESMACGTPVIAFRCGSVPEVVDPGLTGFIVVRSQRRSQRPATSKYSIERWFALPSGGFSVERMG